MINEEIAGKRIAGIDYGGKRTAISVCDELHISITPKKVFNPQEEGFLNDLLEFLKSENVGAIVVGIPFRHDGQKTDVIEEIEDRSVCIVKNQPYRQFSRPFFYSKQPPY